jgi:hypothetical protein
MSTPMRTTVNYKQRSSHLTVYITNDTDRFKQPLRLRVYQFRHTPVWNLVLLLGFEPRMCSNLEPMAVYKAAVLPLNYRSKCGLQVSGDTSMNGFDCHKEEVLSQTADNWSDVKDSNLWHLAPKASALPD